MLTSDHINEDFKDSGKLSVCIPTYNRYKYLKITLENLFRELENYNYEIIIADGGSSDKTLEYIEYLANIKPVKLVKQDSLTGATKAFKICLEKSSGDYFLPYIDNALMKGSTIIKSCQLMDKTNNVDAVIQHFYIRPRKLPVVTCCHKFPYINLHEMVIWRKTKIMNKIDEGYYKHFWTFDLMLSQLIEGACIICTKDVSIVQMHVVQNDDLHIRDKKYNVRKKDEKKFREKWSVMKKLIEADLSFYQKLKNRLYRSFLKYFEQAIKSNKLKPVFAIFNRSEQNCHYSYQFPSKPEALADLNIDHRIRLPYVEPFMHYIYENTSVYVSKNIISGKDFYMFQKFPESLLTSITQDRVKSINAISN